MSGCAHLFPDHCSCLKDEPLTLAQLQARVDELENHTRQDGWFSALTGIGDPNQDKRLSHQHSFCTLPYEEIALLWETDDIAAKAIEAPAAEAFREGYEIVISDEGKYDDLKEQIEQKLLDLDADKWLEKAYQYKRAYGGAAILIGANDGGELIDPLDVSKVTSIDYLNVFEPLEIQPASLYTDPFHPKYGLPEYFQLTTLSTIGPMLPVPGIEQTTPTYQQPIYIHESRLIFFQGIKTSRYYFSTTRQPVSAFWGASVVPRFIETLRDYGVAFAGAGILATDVSQPVITINGLRNMVAQGKDALRQRMQALNLGRSTARAILLDAEKEKFERQTTNLSNVPELLDRLSQRLAAAVGVPLSILVGYSPATLGQPDSSELLQWHNIVRAIQRRELTPILRRLIDLIIRTLRQRKIPRYEVEWRELEHLTILQSAEARLAQARVDTLEVKAGMVYPNELRMSRHRGRFSFETQIDEKKDAPGFIAPLPAGVMPKTLAAGGVVSAFEAKQLGGILGEAATGSHAVGGYTRRDPTQPTLGPNPKVGGDTAGKADDIGLVSPASGQVPDGAYEQTRSYAGFPVRIENKRGSTRHWVDTDGTTGSTPMRYDYGEIENTCGPDGDPVDTYLGPSEHAPWVYVVHQMSKASGFANYDEDKVMLGFDSANHARDAYLSQYNDERFFGGMSQMTVEDFRRHLATSAAGRITHGKLDEFDIVEHLDRIEHRGNKWIVTTEDGSKVLGEFDSEEEAIHRLAQIEFFKQHGH